MKSQLEEEVVCVGAMYVSRHKNKFIKSGQMLPGRIDFQNEIVEMYIRRESEEEGGRGTGEGVVLLDGSLKKGWDQIRPHQ